MKTKLVYFKPIPYHLQKNKSNNSIISVGEKIDWFVLDQEQIYYQWNTCVNAFWFYEKEGKINRQLMVEYYYTWAKTHGYDVELLKYVESSITVNMMAISYLAINEYEYQPSIDTLKSRTNNLIPFAKAEKKKIDDEQKFNSIPKPNKKLSEILGELEEYKDNLVLDFTKLFEEVKVPKYMATEIKNYFKPYADEIIESVSKDADSQLKESFAKVDRSLFKKIANWYSSLLRFLDAYVDELPVRKRMRKTKPKSPAKMVSRLQYLKSFKELNLTSINPEQIFGFTQLYFYDTIRRNLYFYMAKPNTTFGVKGTYITNFDEKLSYSKNVRKPPETINTIMTMARVDSRKYMESIKAVAKSVIGKINSDMIILKGYK